MKTINDYKKGFSGWISFALLLLMCKEAYGSLLANPLRSVLTMLGMLIGVASVSLMVSIGEGAKQKVESSVSSLGSNVFVLSSGASKQGGVRNVSGVSTLSFKDIDALSKLTEVDSVSAWSQSSAQVVYGSNNWGTSIFGVQESFMEIREWPLAIGRTFLDSEGDAKIAVLGKRVAEELYNGKVEELIGETIKIKGIAFKVIGILEEKGQTLDGRDQDDAILIPFSAAQSLLIGGRSNKQIPLIFIKGAASENMESVGEQMRQVLRVSHRLKVDQDDDFTLTNLSAVLNTLNTITSVFSLLLGAIASISLLVGGVGIMNILLVSISERSREIGIRRAIGASKPALLVQFLLEAVFLTFIGGGLGLVVGLLGALGVESFGVPVLITLKPALVSLSVSVGIGLFFGFYPAYKATKLRPIDALRSV